MAWLDRLGIQDGRLRPRAQSGEGPAAQIDLGGNGRHQGRVEVRVGPAYPVQCRRLGEVRHLTQGLPQRAGLAAQEVSGAQAVRRCHAGTLARAANLALGLTEC